MEKLSTCLSKIACLTLVQFRIFFLPFLMCVSNAHREEQWPPILHSTVTETLAVLIEGYQNKGRRIRVWKLYILEEMDLNINIKNKTNGLCIKMIIWIQNLFSYTILCFRFDKRNGVRYISENNYFGESFFFFSPSLPFEKSVHFFPPDRT